MIVNHVFTNHVHALNMKQRARASIQYYNSLLQSVFVFVGGFLFDLTINGASCVVNS